MLFFHASKEAKKSIMCHQLGCVIAKGKRIISKGHNYKIHDYSVHAEVNAIEKLISLLGIKKEFYSLLNSSKKLKVLRKEE